MTGGASKPRRQSARQLTVRALQGIVAQRRPLCLQVVSPAEARRVRDALAACAQGQKMLVEYASDGALRVEGVVLEFEGVGAVRPEGWFWVAGATEAREALVGFRVAPPPA